MCEPVPVARLLTSTGVLYPWATEAVTQLVHASTASLCTFNQTDVRGSAQAYSSLTQHHRDTGAALTCTLLNSLLHASWRAG